MKGFPIGKPFFVALFFLHVIQARDASRTYKSDPTKKVQDHRG